MCEFCRLSRRRFAGGMLAATLGTPGVAWPASGATIEPTLRLPAASAAPRAALTLDACPGGFDTRIASALVEMGVPATIFVTGVWLKQNPAGMFFLKGHADLFAIENHGALHVPPVLGDRPIFGLRPAGDLASVEREVDGGAIAVRAATGVRPTWYRAATGFYSPEAIAPIGALGFKIAGYSLNGDVGASLPAKAVADRIGSARDGDVIVAHFNQPKRASGPGVVEGVKRLRDRGFQFAHLPG